LHISRETPKRDPLKELYSVLRDEGKEKTTIRNVPTSLGVQEKIKSHANGKTRFRGNINKDFGGGKKRAHYLRAGKQTTVASGRGAIVPEEKEGRCLKTI